MPIIKTISINLKYSTGLEYDSILRVDKNKL
jgi:hypothetical protein